MFAGGHQALIEAAHFPHDFDGIIANDPGWDMLSFITSVLWNAQAVTGSSGTSLFSESDLQNLHRSVLSQCDLDDGVKDGVIGTPRLPC